LRRQGRSHQGIISERIGEGKEAMAKAKEEPEVNPADHGEGTPTDVAPAEVTESVPVPSPDEPKEEEE
jgi:hypothetical protein